MKKAVLFVIMVVCVSMWLTGCGKGELESLSKDKDKENKESTKIETLSDTENVYDEEENLDLEKEESNVSIKVIGSNKAIISVTNQRAVELLNMDTYFDGIYLYFFDEDIQIGSISFDMEGWYFDHTTYNQTMDNEPSCISNNDTPVLIEGDCGTIEIKAAGIGDMLRQADMFYSSFWDHDEEVEGFIDEGYIEDVAVFEESDEILEVSYPSKNIAVVRLGGSVIDTYFSGEVNNYLTLAFYPSMEETFLSNCEIQLSKYVETDRSFFVAEFIIYENHSTHESDGSTTWDSLFIGQIPAEVMASDEGISIQIEDEDIQLFLSTNGYIEVLDDEDGLLMAESFDKTVINGSYVIGDIPDVFDKSGRDEDFFYPTTDDYMVVMIDFPKVPVFEFGYFMIRGRQYYGPINTYEAPCKIMTVSSFDEFGIAEERTKIIYDSLYDQMTAPASRLDWLDVEDVFEDEAQLEQARLEFFQQLDENYYGTIGAILSTDYVYHGHYDEVRYFTAGMSDIRTGYFFIPSIEYNQNSQYDEQGFIGTTVPYTIDFADFSEGVSVLKEYMAEVTVYYSKANIK